MGRAVDVEPGLREKERLLHTLGEHWWGGEGSRERSAPRGLGLRGEGRGGRGKREEETEERRGGIEDGGKRGYGGPLVGARLVGGRKIEYE